MHESRIDTDAAASRHAHVNLLGTPVEPLASERRGVSVADVSLSASGFWGQRQAVNAAATFEHCAAWMEKLGWIENFDRIARGEPTVDRPGWAFSDSELYKLLEGMAWELGRQYDPLLADRFAGLVSRVGAAQDPDGYLDTAFGHDGLPDRYSDLSMGHELYNMGHLLQAAVARVRTVGIDDELVSIGQGVADHICTEFGADARDGICGHPEVEVALAEFGRAVNEPRYVAQAALFVARRGHGSLPVRPLLSAEYFQDDVPVRDATVLRGHAVRALYLTAGAIDVAIDTNDSQLFAALESQWLRTLERRTYLTGGMGSRHEDEGFGDDYELPDDRAYCETCAGVASVMVAWRLYLATGKVEYVDVIERTLFNVVATSPAADGTAFFYANPLQQRVLGESAHDGVNMRAEGGVRAPWFDVSCCPTNVARTLASLGAYSASVEGDTLALLQYSEGRVSAGGFVLDVATRYPDDGVVTVTIEAAPEGEATLRLRVPSWAAGARIARSGASVEAVEPGWADVRSVFAPGDVVTLHLPIEPRLTWPDPRIDAVRGSVAVERGPLVLCVESTDLPAGAAIDTVRLDVSRLPEAHGDGAQAAAVARTFADSGSAILPYGRRGANGGSTPFQLLFVPYHRWAERAPSTMRVFIPTTEGDRRAL
nr:beta-L-arabinofuranosidase domain-containing protein [Microbacterium halimionae]